MTTLLLRRCDVFEELPEFDRKVLYEYRRCGELRAFCPGPSNWAFYFSTDVARIQSGRTDWRPEWWDEIEEPDLTVEEFCGYSGLGRDACLEAIYLERIDADRKPSPGCRGFTWRVPREELERFV